MMINWIISAICVVLLGLIVYQLLRANQVFYDLYSQLSSSENLTLSTEAVFTSKSTSNASVIPPNEEISAETALTSKVTAAASRIPPHEEVTSLSSPASSELTLLPDDIDKENTSMVETAPLYVASQQGTRFHRLDCSTVKRIRENNRQYFHSHEEAINAGYNPCSVCHP